MLHFRVSEIFRSTKIILSLNQITQINPEPSLTIGKVDICIGPRILGAPKFLDVYENGILDNF